MGLTKGGDSAKPEPCPNLEPPQVKVCWKLKNQLAELTSVLNLHRMNENSPKDEYIRAMNMKYNHNEPLPAIPCTHKSSLHHHVRFCLVEEKLQWSNSLSHTASMDLLRRFRGVFVGAFLFIPDMMRFGDVRPLGRASVAFAVPRS